MTDNDPEYWLDCLFVAFRALETDFSFVRAPGLSEPTGLLPVMVTARWHREDRRRWVEATLGIRKSGDVSLSVSLRNADGETASLEQLCVSAGQEPQWIGPKSANQSQEAYINEGAKSAIGYLSEYCRSILLADHWVATSFDWAGYR